MSTLFGHARREWPGGPDVESRVEQPDRGDPDKRRARGLELAHPRAPGPAGPRVLVALPDGVRVTRILGDADIVAPVSAEVVDSPAVRDLACRTHFVDRIGRELVPVEGRHALGRGRPGIDDVEDPALGLADARIPRVRAGRPDEHVLDERRRTWRGVELGDAGAVSAAANRRDARVGRGEGEDVVLPDGVGRAAINGVDEDATRILWIGRVYEARDDADVGQVERRG